jgi:endonuclease/exonuclease/phosphatase family metal-dependent hydrolase
MRSVLRALIPAMVLATVVGLQPASAATKGVPRGLHLTARTATSVTVAWKPVRGAVKYRVTLHREGGKPRRQRMTVTETSATFGGLKAKTRYVVAVRAARGPRAKLGRSSKAITVRTTSGALRLRIDSVGVMGVRLDWDDQPGAAAYRLRMGPNAEMTGTTDMGFVPSYASIRGLPHNRTFFAQVASLDASGRVFGTPSPVRKIATAAPPSQPSRPMLTAASFNVRCENCYSGQNGEQPWSVRRAAVVAQIVARKPDVIGIQEASQALIDGSSKSQFEDLRDRLQSAGVPYNVTDMSRYNCADSTSASNCTPQDQGASQGTKVFYNAGTVELLNSGSKLLPSAPGENNRYLAWGIFRQKSTGKKFFFGTVHLQFMASYAELRVQEMKVAMDEIAARNPGLPVIVTGDLNSTRYQSPSNGPYDEVVNRGLVDPLGHTYKSPMVAEKSTAEQRIKANYNSHNNFLRSVNRFAEWQNGSNLDYILTTPMRVWLWETVLDLDANNRLVGTIPSDHNMLMIKAVLP